jgi:hypothetical protein
MISGTPTSCPACWVRKPAPRRPWRRRPVAEGVRGAPPRRVPGSPPPATRRPDGHLPRHGAAPHGSEIRDAPVTPAARTECRPCRAVWPIWAIAARRGLRPRSAACRAGIRAPPPPPASRGGDAPSPRVSAAPRRAGCRRHFRPWYALERRPPARRVRAAHPSRRIGDRRSATAHPAKAYHDRTFQRPPEPRRIPHVGTPPAVFSRTHFFP